MIKSTWCTSSNDQEIKVLAFLTDVAYFLVISSNVTGIRTISTRARVLCYHSFILYCAVYYTDQSLCLLPYTDTSSAAKTNASRVSQYTRILSQWPFITPASVDTYVLVLLVAILNPGLSCYCPVHLILFMGQNHRVSGVITQYTLFVFFYPVVFIL